MPTKVQQPTLPPLKEPIPKSPVLHDDGHHLPHSLPQNWNSQHHTALRLALGSILAPKRPAVSRSSSSGSASPFHPAAGKHAAHNSTPASPASIPWPNSSESQSYPHPHHHHSHHHHQHQHHPSHVPSRLGGRSMSDPNTSRDSAEYAALHPLPFSPNPGSSSSSAAHTPPGPLSRAVSSDPSTNPLPPSTEDIPALMLSPPTPAPPSPSSDDHHEHSHRAASTSSAKGSPSQSGTGTPRPRFVEVLQGKSAWDALIHGSFSS